MSSRVRVTDTLPIVRERSITIILPAHSLLVTSSGGLAGPCACSKPPGKITRRKKSKHLAFVDRWAEREMSGFVRPGDEEVELEVEGNDDLPKDKKDPDNTNEDEEDEEDEEIEDDDDDDDEWEDVDEEEEELEELPNDLDELCSKCADLKDQDPMFLLKLSLFRVSVEDIVKVVDRMGRAAIDIGDGLTLLHQAAQFNRPDIITYLVKEKHHPLEVKTRHGETPLDQAAWRGHVEAAMVLLHFGADVDCQTNLKYSPLHRCAFYNHPRLASLFVLAGANQCLKDKDEMTAYDVAVAQGNNEIASALEPIYANGQNITGLAYATNNPKHPNFRPEARRALLSLFHQEASLADEDDDENEDNNEDDNGAQE